MARSRSHRRYVRTGESRHNPPLFTDIVEFVGPGFGGFAATRLLTRVASTQIAKHSPTWGKHAGAVASVGAFFAAWLLAHKWKWLERFHTPIVVGSAIAALQSLIQIYIPKLGWIVADASPEIGAAQAQKLLAEQSPTTQLNLQPTDEDPNEFTFNDTYDAGRYSKPAAQAAGPGGPAQPDLSDLAIDDAIGQSSNLGVFSN
jgi:hypothetical protein